MKKKTRIFTQEELLNQKYSNLTYYMAWELKEMGALIEFCKFNVNLEPRHIKINGYLRDRIRMDGSHEVVFEVEDE